MLSPVLIFFAVFVYYPIVMSAVLSFCSWGILDKIKFVGLSNYAELFSSLLFLKSLSNTLYYVFFSVFFSTVLAFAAAIFLGRVRFMAGFFKTVYFIPAITGMVAVAIIFKWIYEPRVGILNYLLSLVGIPPKPWLLDENLAMPAVILLSIWKHTGFYAIIILTGLKAISHELYEAAMMDGATAWQQVRLITLPLLKPITFFVLTMNMIRAWQVFSEIYVMTSGGPIDSTRVVVFDIWQSAFQYLRLGYGAAASYVLFGIILAITLIQKRLTRLDA